jgi:branched-chain amino acid transport system permease protein
MVYVLVWVIVGGTATFYGPIIGVAVLSVVNDFFLRAFEIWRPLIYGCILIASIMFLPDGLESLPSKLRGIINRLKGREHVEATDTEKKREEEESRKLRTKSWWLLRRP